MNLLSRKLNYFRAAQYLDYFRWNPHTQNHKAVRDTLLMKEIKDVDWTTTGRLGRYSLTHFEDIMRIVDIVRQNNPFIEDIKVDRPENIPQRDNPYEHLIDFANTPEEIFLSCVSERTLDLRDLHLKILQYQVQRNESAARPLLPSPSASASPVSADYHPGLKIEDSEAVRILKILDDEIDHFQKVLDKHGEVLTVGKILNSLGRGIEHFGFNFVVYKVNENGKLVLHKATRKWGKSKYDEEEYPTSTLKSVLEGKKIIYDVDITDDETVIATFRREGLEPDWESIRKDRARSKGDGRMLFVKIGDEAVVMIHNRVGANEDIAINPPPVLPRNEREAEIVKRELRLYFAGIVLRAIESVKSKKAGEIGVVHEGTQKPFSPVQYYGGSEMSVSGKFTTEYNGNPAKNYARIWELVLKQYNQVVNDILGAALPEGEMRDHALYVSHSFTDRVGKEVTGFAVSDEHTDYINAKGKIERLIYYAGIMVKKEYRGGRTAYLTFKMMMKIFRKLGAIKLLFSKTPLVYRTQDTRINKLGGRYYSAKSDPNKFTKEEWSAIRFVAEKYHWELEEETNICRDCYNKMMADDQKYLLPGLEERDGAICVGSVSWKSFLMLLWDVLARRRAKFNGDKPKVRTTA